MTFDVIIRNATLIDGTLHQVDDVGISGQHIDAIGSIPTGTACGREIDAAELVLSPGFIDIHTHSDVSLYLDPRGESKVRQGVTTEVVGNCGFSAFPVNPQYSDLHRDFMTGVGDDPVDPSWTDLDGYVTQLQARRPALNVAPFVGHGAVRMAVMGVDAGGPNAHQTVAMERLVAEAMEQGAWGLSTGLTYVPSGFATTDEIVALSRVVARHGGLYATHARVQAGSGTEAITDACDIGRRAEVRVQYSHLAVIDPRHWGSAADVLQVFHHARERGIDIAFDVYPYDASASSLSQYLPAWVQEGGVTAMAARLADPSIRRAAVRELADGWYGGIPWDWNRVIVSRCGDGADALVGKSLQELAEQMGTSPPDLALRLCERYGNSVQVVFFSRTEQDMLSFLRDDLASVGSDGSAIAMSQGANRPHPRFYGTFPRVLGKYVREEHVISLSEAVRKMSQEPADRLGLHDRGRLIAGLAADLVIFDPARVADRATYTAPCQAPDGILYVMVNGELVVDGQQQTQARPGTVLLKA